MPGEAFADIARQRFAGRGADPHRHLFARRQVGRGQHAGIQRGHAVEHGGAMPRQTLEHRLWGRAFAHQHHGGADG
ncbi:hypothetical protein G6F65_022377 [Rhizopus arrhizus]|nr:hypothetical protein G6F65_022377 [Rhizopus arrhizus]